MKVCNHVQVKEMIKERLKDACAGDLEEVANTLGLNIRFQFPYKFILENEGDDETES